MMQGGWCEHAGERLFLPAPIQPAVAYMIFTVPSLIPAQRTPVFAGKASMGVKVAQPISQPFSDLQTLLSCISRTIYYR